MWAHLMHSISILERHLINEMEDIQRAFKTYNNWKKSCFKKSIKFKLINKSIHIRNITFEEIKMNWDIHYLWKKMIMPHFEVYIFNNYVTFTKKKCWWKPGFSIEIYTVMVAYILFKHLLIWLRLSINRLCHSNVVVVFSLFMIKQINNTQKMVSNKISKICH